MSRYTHFKIFSDSLSHDVIPSQFEHDHPYILDIFQPSQEKQTVMFANMIKKRKLDPISVSLKSVVTLRMVLKHSKENLIQWKVFISLY